MFLLLAICAARRSQNSLREMVRDEIAQQQLANILRGQIYHDIMRQIGEFPVDTNDDLSPPIMGVHPGGYGFPQYLPVDGGTYATPQGVRRRGFQFTFPGSLVSQPARTRSAPSKLRFSVNQKRDPSYGSPYVQGRMPDTGYELLDSRYDSKRGRRLGSPSALLYSLRHRTPMRSFRDVTREWAVPFNQRQNMTYMLTLGVFPLEPGMD